MVSDGNGVPVSSSVTATELGYVSGLTSALQTQIDAKQATLSLPLAAASGGTGIAGAYFPVWTKYSTGHAALQAAALTNNITLFTLPAKAVIHKIILKQTTAFLGTLIATYTISIGIAGSLTKYIAIYDVMAAVASSTFGVGAASINFSPEDFSSGVAIKISAVSTVANLNQSTAGAVDTYVLTSLLP